MVIERRRTIVILPDREVDLGVIGPMPVSRWNAWGRRTALPGSRM